MTGENFHIYCVYITGKCIRETFLPTWPWYDLIISPHVKQFVQKVCSPMQSFFKKKVFALSLPVSKSFIPNFCSTNCGLSSKTTWPLFLKSYSMVMKFSKAELQNHLEVNLSLICNRGKKNLYSVI